MNTIPILQYHGNYDKQTLGLKSQQIIRFKELIAKFNHHLRVIVHPWYDDCVDDEDYERNLDILLKSAAKQSAPILILEQADRIADITKELFTNYDPSNGNIIFVPTDWNYPTPAFLFSLCKSLEVELEPIGDQKWIENLTRWQLLINFLKSVEVEKCTVGGKQLKDQWIKSDYEPIDPIPDTVCTAYQDQRSMHGITNANKLKPGGCVGITGLVLARHFDVDFSYIASPKSRRDLRALEKT